MNRNKINFVTGESYTLAELFSENRRIVIPDLQRDYCWGDETNKKSSGATGELITDFINNLIEIYDRNNYDTLNMGLFYGYEVPTNHIQLCDGQQRLTTLYLLIGMINRKVGKFRQNLISDYEYKHDDKEPYLNYAIRESSLYFLSDLVCRFFIGQESSVDKIEEADWYFSEYSLDPSICSMISALKIIEEILFPKDINWLFSFGNWVLHNLSFLYFDMGNRRNGEETFVIINTTGEPLSATQNLKPLIINAEINRHIENVDRKWEEIETWFWKNRKGYNDTADAGFAEFLRWISVIEQRNELLPDKMKSDKKEYLIQDILQGKEHGKFQYEKISFNTIYKYWKSLVWIMENNGSLFHFNSDILSPTENKDVNNKKAISQAECFRLLPILRFVYNNLDMIIEDTSVQRNALRIYKFFSNIIQIENVTKSVNSLVRHTIDIIEILAENNKQDIISILDFNNINGSILSEEEKCKLNILKNSFCRNEVEELFWDIQKHPIWKGEIFPLIKWSSDSNGNFDFEKFKQYVKVFKLLFPGYAKHDLLTDALRRSIIVNQENYVPVFRNNNSYYASFGWEWSDWRILLCRDGNNTAKLFEYINEQLKDTALSMEDILYNYINGSKTKKNYIEFAESPYLLSFTSTSYTCDMKWENNDWQICVSGGIGKHTRFFSRKNAYILKEFGGEYNNTSGNKIEIPESWWKIWYWGDSSRSNCIVFERKNDIKLDVRFISFEDNKGKLEIELKRQDNLNDLSEYSELLNEFISCSDNKTDTIIISIEMDFDTKEIKKQIEIMMEKVDKILQ